MSLQVLEDDLSSNEVQALVAEHLAGMHDTSPAEHVNALALDSLRREDVTFWIARDNGILCGCGALKALGEDSGEIKSMRTRAAFLRRGVGQAVLDQITHTAMQRGYKQLLLETGTGAAFEPAQALYLRNGFRWCGAFGDYRETSFNVFMRKDLAGLHALSSDRLMLQPLEVRDAQALLGVFQNPDVRRYLLDDTLVDQEWVREEIASSQRRFTEGSAGLWAIRRASESTILGFVGFRHFFAPPRLQLLYGLLPEHWGQGLATEAAQMVCAYAFEGLGFDRIEAAMDTPNTASIELAKRLGMTAMPNAAVAHPDTVFYEIHRSESRTV